MSVDKNANRNEARLRFHGELNDFLPPEKRGRWLSVRFPASPAVKDPIEALGVPHPEVDVILSGGESVDFAWRLPPGGRADVYPAPEPWMPGSLRRLRPEVPQPPSFVLDVHLGRLASYLRMLGYDTLYDNGYMDTEIVRLSASGGRVALTRDVELLKHGGLKLGRWIRSTSPRDQLAELIRSFGLDTGPGRPSRCAACNGAIEPVAKEEVRSELPPNTLRYYDNFFRCAACGRIYWRGSHYARLRGLIDEITDRGG